ncbi:MAG: glucose-1-phosphate adenylyltransferase [Parachlamydiaceae bacterium]|nr:glucose-1-phosphate adenylyltransferase [Parachlamydiaceae bacterium]
MSCLSNPIKTLLRKAPKMRREDSILPDMSEVTTIILGGGEGKRLFPLTQSCCKPNISFGGRYRLIDVPISSAINSGCHKIFVITQFLSTALHRHIIKTYSHFGFDSSGIEILSPELKPGKKSWFEGTADAVRQNLDYFLEFPTEYFLILSGDQLYSMDFRKILQIAKSTNADLVLAAQPITKNDCQRMGVLQVNENQMITKFLEKPKDASDIEGMEFPKNLKNQFSKAHPQKSHLGSLGIYLFKKEALLKLLVNDHREDFGMHLLPSIIAHGNSAAYLFDGYWEDIGTIESFYTANMKLTYQNPEFNFYDETKPVYTSHSNLAASKILASQINNCMICNGSLIEKSKISHSILGPRTVIRKGCVIKDTYIIGNDFYQRPALTKELTELLDIGKNCTITKTIIDVNVRIGENVTLVNKDNLLHYDGENIYIRNGVIIVPRNTTIPDGFTL